MEKEQFGYEQGLVRYLQNDEKSIPKGSFVIIPKKGNHYWFFNRSNGPSRLIYLCSINDKGSESSSFINSVRILKEKLKGYNKTRTNDFTKVIDDYVQSMKNEGYSNRRGVERSLKTTQDIIYHINKFREYVVQNPITLKSVQLDSFRDYVSDYITFLIDKGFKPSTIRVQLIHLRQFLDELVEPRRGSSIIKRNPITQKFIKSEFSINKQDEIKPNFYSEDTYFKLLELCNKRVREIWIDWIKTQKKPPKKDLVYFTTLLQLVYGFRIGEVIKCYLSYEIKEQNHNKKDGYSYIGERVLGKGYNLIIFYKKKYGEVFVDYTIHSWNNRPPENIHHWETEDMYQKTNYTTNIIDVILHLFASEKHLTSTYIDTHMSFFKQVIVEEYKFKDLGVNFTHDLRDMCINYLVHTKKESLQTVSRLTRHDVKTLETYYLHYNTDISIKKSEDLNTKNRLSEIKQRFKDKLEEED
jgi:integrase